MEWDLIEDVPDMSQKNILITGCTSGVGLEAASQLVSRNATIIMACRNREKMSAVAKVIKERHNISDAKRIIELELDVSDLESVRSFPNKLKEAGITNLYSIVLNAGIVERDFKTSRQNVELTFATNILGQWLLTILLLPYIKDNENSRIVALSSVAHAYAKTIDYKMIRAALNSSDISYYKNSYSGRYVYMQTKLCTHWFIAELNRRLKTSNAKTIGVVAHPGYAVTAMSTPSSIVNKGWFSEQLIHFIASPFRQSGEQGAWPLVFAASDPFVSPHFNYGPSSFGGLWGPPVRDSYVSPNAGNVSEQGRLWTECENLCGETSPI